MRRPVNLLDDYTPIGEKQLICVAVPFATAVLLLIQFKQDKHTHRR